MREMMYFTLINPEERYKMGDVVMERRIILKWKLNAGLCTVGPFIWFRICIL
jgi:hypothetical protein